ncbi:Hypoxanthine-guanine phosphoribosyltransferase [Zancudomyces culisetae]|uniref:Hypoxanthine phosphoribosyltransferase n=1 Tax=Zancudomyces culisetae TaxID=1213189 RepID=A0A1R1PGK8_ZANCU|nr:Hypoxanthine-guanine phosphoribosyltransferase [Zancudomyces culisetae]|eukprot:OMH80077.1 Hypoxanthine-guanine phosphoribosyltransferase [Zancudomyces culisetae]
MAQESSWIDVTGNGVGYNLSHFTYPEHYSEDITDVIIPNGLIIDRVEKLARTIIEQYDGRLVICCVLKGGHQFFADLVSFLKKFTNKDGKHLPFSLDFIRLQSYCNDESTGEVKISMTEKELRDLEGKDVLLVEDIIDTGKSMVTLLDCLKRYNLKSVKVASLLLKDTPRSNGFVPDYVGFLIPDKFIVGYCLDYNDVFRDLDHICTISEIGKKKYAK